MLHSQKSYLLMLREVIGRLSGSSGNLSDDQKEDLTILMEQFLPRPLQWLVASGCDAVAQEIARRPTATGVDRTSANSQQALRE